MIAILRLLIFFFILSSMPLMGQNQSTDLSDKYSDTLKIHKALVTPHYALANMDSLIQELNILYRSSVKLNYWHGRLYSIHYLAHSYGLLANHELSLRFWQEALKIANEKSGFHREIADIYMTISIQYKNESQLNDHIYWLKVAEKYILSNKLYYATTRAFDEDMWQLNYHFVHAYFNVNNLKDSKKYLDYVFKYVDKNNIHLFVDLNYFNYKKSLIQKNYPSCLFYLNNINNLLRKIDGDDKRRIFYYNCYPPVYSKMGKYDLAYAYADSTIAYDKRYIFPYFRIRTQNDLINIDKASGNFSSAIARLEKLQAYKDSVYTKNQSNLAAYYQTQLEVQDYVKALRQEEESSTKKNTIIAGVSLAGLLSLIGLNIWFSRKYKFIKKSHQDEKTEVGNDIHDVINPTLSYIRMTLYYMSLSAEHDGEKLNEITKALDSSILEVRKLSSWIRKTNEFHNFEAVLSDMLVNYGSVYNLDISFIYRINESVLSSSAKANVYFILEELILNTWRHAGATIAKVSILTKGKTIVVQYGDNGKGFALDHDYKSTGLSSIKHRIQRMEGLFHYEPLPADERYTYFFWFEIPIK